MKRFFSHIYKYFRWYVLAGLTIIVILVVSAYLHENRHGILKFVVLDIGQGDSLFIESPTGVQVLVDGGPNKALMKEIPRVIPWYDRQIDMIVVTNPDKDHYEGFLPLMKKYKVGKILEPGTNSPTDTYAFLEKEIIEKKITKVLATRGQRIDLGAGAYLEILFPDRDISGLSSNDGSIVMRLVYGETSVMLQGDSTSRIEDYMLTLGTTTLKSTILKAGHHGSRTSSESEYVTAVAPKWTVISSGAENSYGHPHKETLETMEKLKIPTFDTCNNGRLVFESDGKNFVLKNKNPKLAVVGCKIKA